MDNHEFAARFKRYADILGEESDRGSIIVGAAIVEDLLEQVLVARLVPALEKDDELFSGASAPAGTFSAKIDLAYRVGCIGLVQRSTFHLIRKMRNDAAHAGDQRDMDTPQLQNRLRELFRLQEEPVKALWATIQGTEYMKTFLAARGSHPQDLVSGIGWRLSWNMLVASLATGLSELPEQESRLRLQEPPPSKEPPSA